jgi:hypothetical protein
MMRPPDIAGLWNPVVGQGAAYEMTDSNQKRPIEITIVGKETVNGKDGYWMEFGMADPRTSQTMYAKMLLAPDEQTFLAPQRMIVQVPGQPNPMEFPMNPSARRSTLSDIRNKAQKVGSESITVPAGTFTCDHWHSNDNDGDAWTSDKVGPFGLVKAVNTKSTMILVKTISDAQDHITGTPMKFDPANMRPH